MIKLGGNLRIKFQYLIQKVAKEGKVPLSLVRGGKEVQVELPVSANYPQVLPSLEGTYPSYFAFGPLVFSTATTELVSGLTQRSAGASWMARLAAVNSPLLKRWFDKPAFADEGLVIVSSPFFPHKLTRGYDNPMLQVVKTLNGVPIKNLNHLVEVLRDSKDEFIRIEFDMRGAETLVFPRADLVAATDDSLTDNGVRSQAHLRQ
jgi:PDZ domain